METCQSQQRSSRRRRTGHRPDGAPPRHGVVNDTETVTAGEVSAQSGGY
ncbi:hypothetical protein [Nitrosomonas communis]|nr:hypothetical protein [Nitrosomonas communis]MCO6427761.1 hypothetical protein [Nitrosomonas communis]